MSNKNSEENDKVEVSNVYEMFEEVKALEEKQLTAIEKLCSKFAPTSESTPVLDSEYGKKIETLETIFTYDRNTDSIKLIRCQVVQYERLVKERAENATRARLNAAEAQRLQNEVETVKGGK